jgi:hypothetical protein
LLLYNPTRPDPEHFSLQWSNDPLSPIVGDDSDNQVFSFYSAFSRTRNYDAQVRAYGKTASSWGTYIEMTHNGTNGFLSTDTGHLVLSPAGNVGLGTANPQSPLHIDRSSGEASIRLTSGGISWPLILHMTETSNFIITNGGKARLTITASGNVGLGTNAPQDALHVAGQYVLVEGAGHERAYLGGDGAASDVELGSQNAAVEWVSLWNTALGRFMKLAVAAVQISGGSDIAEPFPMSPGDIPKGAVVIIDEAKPGQLKLSERAYDTRVAGIVSGANGVNPGITLSQQSVFEGGQQVALSGRVFVLADASTGAIRPGDLLTTSGTPGHAMRVTDHGKAQGAIIGKAMSNLDAGRGMVLVLVSLQ